jgi:hypothetical protein
MLFRIYDQAGTLLAEEEQSNVTVEKGIFSVLLGGGKPLGALPTIGNLPFDREYFLEIWVNGEKMEQRQRITSAAYAIRAETAEKFPRLITDSELNTISSPGKINATALANLGSIPSVAGILPVANGGTGLTGKLCTIVTYTGDGRDNRAVAHGLGVAPEFIMLIRQDVDSGAQIITWTTHMTPAGNAHRADGGWSGWVKSVDTSNVILNRHPNVNENGRNYTMICWRGQ